MKKKVNKMEAQLVSDASKFKPFSFGDNRNNACGTLNETKQSYIYAPKRI